MKSPRPYQTESFEAIQQAHRDGLRRIIVELATGLGKTVIFVLLTLRAIKKGSRVLILVNRDVLVSQAIEELARHGIFAQREQALERAPLTADVVVGSVQSMQGKWLQKWRRDHFKVVICDECHGSRAKTFQSILTHFEGAFHLGVTATAERHDKKGLWSGYEEIVYRMPLRTWTDPETGIVTPGGQNEGWLVNFQFEELAVPLILSDAVANGTGSISEEDEITQFKRDNYLSRLFYEASEKARGAKGIAFLPGCSASEECAKEMRDRGIDAQHIEGYMSKNKILEVLKWFKETKQGILCNADMLSVGYNQPDVDWIGMFRISRSTPMYKQRLGRGTRPLGNIDQFPHSAADRLRVIAESSKPICRVIDLMIQNEDHNLATPSCLITDDPEEIKALNSAKRSASSLNMDELDDELGKFRIKNPDKQLEKLANDAANASFKTKRKEPYYGHILSKQSKPEWKDATPYQIERLRAMGYTGPENIKSTIALQISQVFEKHLAKNK